MSLRAGRQSIGRWRIIEAERRCSKPAEPDFFNNLLAHSRSSGAAQGHDTQSAIDDVVRSHGREHVFDDLDPILKFGDIMSTDMLIAVLEANAAQTRDTAAE